MGVSAELTSRRGVRRAIVARRGMALPSALFGLVTVSVLATAIFASSRSQSMSTRNRESATRAIQLADNGMTHALVLVGDTLKGYPFTWLLRGSDNVANNTDDGVIAGYIVSSAADIPAGGRAGTGGSYTVRIIDDPADGDADPKTDRNLKVIVRCTATTSDGGSASVDAVISQVVLPAIANDGNMTIGTQAQILGQCGAIHANGNLTLPTAGSNFPTIAGTITATGTTTGTARDTLAATKTPVAGAPAVAIPDLNPPDFCPAGAEFLLRADGRAVRVSTGEVRNAQSAGLGGAQEWGFRYQTPPTWTMVQAGAVSGSKICVDGNFEISGNMGTAAAPFLITAIATGSVSVTGTPFLAPATTDSILIVSGGDVNLAGNSSGTASNYEGMVYAENQCAVSGSPRMSAQILCKNKTPTLVSAPMTAISSPFTAFTVKDWAATTSIGGSAIIEYRCGGLLAKRRVYSWVQRVL
jgi:hypothetical protein